jgi:hypothetical protein
MVFAALRGLINGLQSPALERHVNLALSMTVGSLGPSACLLICSFLSSRIGRGIPPRGLRDTPLELNGSCQVCAAHTVVISCNAVVPTPRHGQRHSTFHQPQERFPFTRDLFFRTVSYKAQHKYCSTKGLQDADGLSRYDSFSSLRLRLRLANATVQSAGPSNSHFWHASHFRHFSHHFSARAAEGGARWDGWRGSPTRALKSGGGNERPCFRLSIESQALYAGPKGRLRRRSDRF